MMAEPIQTMNWYKWALKKAKKTKSPVKYSILAYVMYSDENLITARKISRALHLKLSTTRTYLNKLFHEAEVDCGDYDPETGKLSKEKLWDIEREWNEQPSILTGLFMTQKDYKEFKQSDSYKENKEYAETVCKELVFGKQSSQKNQTGRIK